MNPQTNHEPLASLYATQAETLKPLLGDLFGVEPFKVEQFGPLTKYTLGQMPNGHWAMIHHIREPDSGPPHCHPCDMRSRVIKGSYVERIWQPCNGSYEVEDLLRTPANPRFISADCIHKIIDLPLGECWTFVKAGPVIREWRHYPELENNN